jgi:hypothetical protein
MFEDESRKVDSLLAPLYEIWNQPGGRCRLLTMGSSRSFTSFTLPITLVGIFALVIASCSTVKSGLVSVRVGSSDVSIPSASQGATAFANLGVTEICGLIDLETVNSLMDFSFDGEQWRRDANGSQCGFDSTSDGFQGDRLATHWFVGAPGTLTPMNLGAAENVVRTERVIDGVPALLFVSGERAEVQVALSNRTLSVASATADKPERIAKNPERIIALMRKLVAATQTLQPADQPEPDAKVASAFDMSPTQVCSLLQMSTVDALRALPGITPPRGTNAASVTNDQADCARSEGLLSLSISSWATNNETPLRIAGLPAFWSATGDGPAQNLTVTTESVRNVEGGQRETVVALSAVGVPDSPQVRALLTSEMEYMIGELGRRLPEPLVWQLLDRVVPNTTMEPLPTP